MTAATGHRAGHVAILGRPNVGKSTLLNACVGAKLAIVTPRPQTTRARLLGIRTLPEAQIAFIDTPGIHQARTLLGRRMVAAAEEALSEADVALLVIDAATGLESGDDALARTLAAAPTTSLVVLNKRDRIAPPALLPMMAALGALLPGRDVVPASARTGEGVAAVLAAIVAALPAGPPLYPLDELTDASERTLVQEVVREQLFLQLGEEVPYGTAVVVEEFREREAAGLAVVRATILVDRPSHRGIVIGAGGTRLRTIGERARLALERLLARRLHLELFVRVERDWAKSPRRLRELGL